MRFIRDHACDGVGVDDVVGAALASRRFLERRFQAVLGRSPNREILRVRIDRARLLLIETDLTLASIAQKSGFRGPKYFGDAFVRETGLPPAEFRRQSRSGNASSPTPSSR
jgi:LacI family transcriptional regulator